MIYVGIFAIGASVIGMMWKGVQTAANPDGVTGDVVLNGDSSGGNGEDNSAGGGGGGADSANQITARLNDVTTQWGAQLDYQGNTRFAIMLTPETTEQLEPADGGVVKIFGRNFTLRTADYGDPNNEREVQSNYMNNYKEGDCIWAASQNSILALTKEKMTAGHTILKDYPDTLDYLISYPVKEGITGGNQVTSKKVITPNKGNRKTVAINSIGDWWYFYPNFYDRDNNNFNFGTGKINFKNINEGNILLSKGTGAVITINGVDFVLVNGVYSTYQEWWAKSEINQCFLELDEDYGRYKLYFVIDEKFNNGADAGNQDTPDWTITF